MSFLCYNCAKKTLSQLNGFPPQSHARDVTGFSSASRQRCGHCVTWLDVLHCVGALSLSVVPSETSRTGHLLLST